MPAYPTESSKDGALCFLTQAKMGSSVMQPLPLGHQCKSPLAHPSIGNTNQLPGLLSQTWVELFLWSVVSALSEVKSYFFMSSQEKSYNSYYRLKKHDMHFQKYGAGEMAH